MTSYYCFLVALSIYYLVVSCYPVLPWTVCQEGLQSELSKICIPTSENKSRYIDCYDCYHNTTTPQHNDTICVQASTDISQLDWSNTSSLNDTICVKAGTDMTQLNWSNTTNLTDISSTEQYFFNGTLDWSNTTNLTAISSAEQYFKASVLKEKTDISDGLGLPDPTLAGCLAVCWFLLYLTLRKVSKI